MDPSQLPVTITPGERGTLKVTISGGKAFVYDPDAFDYEGDLDYAQCNWLCGTFRLGAGAAWVQTAAPFFHVPTRSESDTGDLWPIMPADVRPALQLLPAVPAIYQRRMATIDDESKLLAELNARYGPKAKARRPRGVAWQVHQDEVFGWIFYAADILPFVIARGALAIMLTDTIALSCAVARPEQAVLQVVD